MELFAKLVLLSILVCQLVNILPHTKAQAANISSPTTPTKIKEETTSTLLPTTPSTEYPDLVTIDKVDVTTIKDDTDESFHELYEKYDQTYNNKTTHNVIVDDDKEASETVVKDENEDVEVKEEKYNVEEKTTDQVTSTDKVIKNSTNATKQSPSKVIQKVQCIVVEFQTTTTNKTDVDNDAAKIQHEELSFGPVQFVPSKNEADGVEKEKVYVVLPTLVFETNADNVAAEPNVTEDLITSLPSTLEMLTTESGYDDHPLKISTTTTTTSTTTEIVSTTKQPTTTEPAKILDNLISHHDEDDLQKQTTSFPKNVEVLIIKKQPVVIFKENVKPVDVLPHPSILQSITNMFWNTSVTPTTEETFYETTTEPPRGSIMQNIANMFWNSFGYKHAEGRNLDDSFVVVNNTEKNSIENTNVLEKKPEVGELRSDITDEVKESPAIESLDKIGDPEVQQEFTNDLKAAALDDTEGFVVESEGTQYDPFYEDKIQLLPNETILKQKQLPKIDILDVKENDSSNSEPARETTTEEDTTNIEDGLETTTDTLKLHYNLEDELTTTENYPEDHVKLASKLIKLDQFEEDLVEKIVFQQVAAEEYELPALTTASSFDIELKPFNPFEHTMVVEENYDVFVTKEELLPTSYEKFLKEKRLLELELNERTTDDGGEVTTTETMYETTTVSAHTNSKDSISLSSSEESTATETIVKFDSENSSESKKSDSTTSSNIEAVVVTTILTKNYKQSGNGLLDVLIDTTYLERSEVTSTDMSENNELQTTTELELEHQQDKVETVITKVNTYPSEDLAYEVTTQDSSFDEITTLQQEIPTHSEKLQDLHVVTLAKDAKYRSEDLISYATLSKIATTLDETTTEFAETTEKSNDFRQLTPFGYVSVVDILETESNKTITNQIENFIHEEAEKQTSKDNILRKLIYGEQEIRVPDIKEKPDETQNLNNNKLPDEWDDLLALSSENEGAASKSKLNGVLVPDHKFRSEDSKADQVITPEDKTTTANALQQQESLGYISIVDVLEEESNQTLTNLLQNFNNSSLESAIGASNTGVFSEILNFNITNLPEDLGEDLFSQSSEVDEIVTITTVNENLSFYKGLDIVEPETEDTYTAEMTTELIESTTVYEEKLSDCSRMAEKIRSYKHIELPELFTEFTEKRCNIELVKITEETVNLDYTTPAMQIISLPLSAGSSYKKLDQTTENLKTTIKSAVVGNVIENVDSYLETTTTEIEEEFQSGDNKYLFIETAALSSSKTEEHVKSGFELNNVDLAPLTTVTTNSAIYLENEKSETVFKTDSQPQLSRRNGQQEADQHGADRLEPDQHISDQQEAEPILETTLAVKPEVKYSGNTATSLMNTGGLTVPAYLHDEKNNDLSTESVRFDLKTTSQLKLTTFQNKSIDTKEKPTNSSHKVTHTASKEIIDKADFEKANVAGYSDSKFLPAEVGKVKAESHIVDLTTTSTNVIPVKNSSTKTETSDDKNNPPSLTRKLDQQGAFIPANLIDEKLNNKTNKTEIDVIKHENNENSNSVEDANPTEKIFATPTSYQNVKPVLETNLKDKINVEYSDNAFKSDELIKKENLSRQHDYKTQNILDGLKNSAEESSTTVKNYKTSKPVLEIHQNEFLIKQTKLDVKIKAEPTVLNEMDTVHDTNDHNIASTDSIAVKTKATDLYVQISTPKANENPTVNNIEGHSKFGRKDDYYNKESSVFTTITSHQILQPMLETKLEHQKENMKIADQVSVTTKNKIPASPPTLNEKVTSYKKKSSEDSSSSDSSDSTASSEEKNAALTNHKTVPEKETVKENNLEVTSEEELTGSTIDTTKLTKTDFGGTTSVYQYIEHKMKLSESTKAVYDVTTKSFDSKSKQKADSPEEKSKEGSDSSEESFEATTTTTVVYDEVTEDQRDETTNKNHLLSQNTPISTTAKDSDEENDDSSKKPIKRIQSRKNRQRSLLHAEDINNTEQGRIDFAYIKDSFDEVQGVEQEEQYATEHSISKKGGVTGTEFATDMTNTQAETRIAVEKSEILRTILEAIEAPGEMSRKIETFHESADSNGPVMEASNQIVLSKSTKDSVNYGMDDQLSTQNLLSSNELSSAVSSNSVIILSMFIACILFVTGVLFLVSRFRNRFVGGYILPV